jgi:hypothetical protein
MSLDPTALFPALGLKADPWQERVLRSTAARTLLLCARQAGKSTTTAVLALHTAVYRANSLVLLVSPSLRQSSELYRKVMGFYRALGRPVPAQQETSLTLALDNGSRVVSLPSSPETIRGYSAVTLLVVDEAAMVSDDMFVAINPMLATSKGRLVCLSTPLGKRGWFHDAWNESTVAWERHRVTAAECPRIERAFLAEQRVILGERWYRQEYECSFEATLDQYFTTESVLGAFESDQEPLFASGAPWPSAGSGEPRRTRDASRVESNVSPLFGGE